MADVAAGRTDALDCLYRAYRGPLRGYFLRMGVGAGLADDLVHDTFARVLRYRTSFRGDGSFRGWLFGIARNVLYRTRDADADHAPVRDDVPASDDVDRRLELRDRVRVVEDALWRLSTEDRELILLGRVEGIPYREIGRMLNCTEGAVKVRMFRALRRLTQQLPDDWQEQP